MKAPAAPRSFHAAARRRAHVIASVLLAAMLACLLAAGPAAAKAHPYNLGCKALEAGDIAEATKQFKLAVKLEPNDTDALNNLAVCYLETADYAKADGLLEKVLRLNAKYRGADLNIGAGFILRGDPAAGEPSTRKATDAPDTKNGREVEASAYYNLGLIEAAAGDYAAAQDDLEKSAAARPSLSTDVALGVVQCAQGDYDAGIVSLQRAHDALAAEPPSTDGETGRPLAEVANANLAAAHYQRGMSELERGETAAAKTDFTRSIDLQPNDYAEMGLALVAAEEGDTAAAEEKLAGLEDSAAPGVAAAVAANLTKVREMSDGGGGGVGEGGVSDDWLDWLVLIGGGALFAVQTFAVLRAAATRPRGPLAVPLAGLGAAAGVATAAVFALSYLGTLDGSTYVLATLAVDVVIVVLTLAAPSLGRGRARTA